MAATMEIVNDELHVEIKGWDKLFSLKSQLSVPLKHIKGVKKDASTAGDWISGIKVMGGRIPGVMKTGTFLSEGKKVFWDVHHPEKALVIELHDETFSMLVIEVEDPDSAVKMIQDAIPA